MVQRDYSPVVNVFILIKVNQETKKTIRENEKKQKRRSVLKLSYIPVASWFLIKHKPITIFSYYSFNIIFIASWIPHMIVYDYFFYGFMWRGWNSLFLLFFMFIFSFKSTRGFSLLDFSISFIIQQKKKKKKKKEANSVYN